MSRNESDPLPGRPRSLSASAVRLKEHAEERLERRQYIPGDDPRRIDWKHYARTGGLQIRVGEEGVPYRGRTWILLFVDGAGRGRRGDRRVDGICEAAASVGSTILEHGRQLMARLPGEDRWNASSTREAWGDRLARVEPSLDTGFDILPGPGDRIIVLADPGSSMAVTAAARVGGEGRRVSVLYVSRPAVGPNGGSGPWWRRPAGSRGKGFSRWLGAYDRLRAEKAATDARGGGIDAQVF